MKRLIVYLWIFFLAFILTGCKSNTDAYGVFLDADYNELLTDTGYDVLVLDAQYYDASQIASLKKTNGKILSYINIGSLEDFRDYFDEYKSVTLDEYENWEGEYWVDVTDLRWQRFLLDELVPSYIDKGVDGFFVDNVDVYYTYQSNEVFDGIVTILGALKNTQKEVIVNGGDVFVSKYLDEYGNLSDILDGVNQECVFTTIDFDNNDFYEALDSDCDYYLDYLSRVYSTGTNVYIIEYTDNKALKNKIEKQCEELGYSVYISDSIDLD